MHNQTKLYRAKGTVVNRVLSSLHLKIAYNLFKANNKFHLLAQDKIARLKH